MITIHRIAPTGFTSEPVAADALTPEVTAGAVWIDLAAPSEAEVAAVCSAVGLGVSPPRGHRRTEGSDRLYRRASAHVMAIDILTRGEQAGLGREDLTFFLTPERLVTVHPGPAPLAAPPDAALLAEVEHRPLRLLEWIVEDQVERIAVMIERVEADVESLSLDVFGSHPGHGGRRVIERDRLSRRLLRQIARSGNGLGKMRQSLHTIARMLSYLAHVEDDRFGPRRAERALGLAGDVRGLLEQAGFLSQSLTFVLDAALGMIGIEQSTIVRIFTIVSVIFLPPTLVGTVYGMNFDLMPELDWPWGYPFALVLMAISAVLPYWWARRRGWF